jgi:hypothetical protein
MALKRNHNPDAQAAKRDLCLRAELRDEVRKAEKELLCGQDKDLASLAPLNKILVSPVVTDVISLNVDLVLERLVAGLGAKLPRVSGFNDSSERRCVITRFDGVLPLRVWHPQRLRPCHVAIVRNLAL